MRIHTQVALIISSITLLLIGMFQLRVRMIFAEAGWVAESLASLQSTAVVLAHATSPIMLICVALFGTFLAVETHHTYAWLQLATALVATLAICWLIKETTQIGRPEDAQLVATGLSEYAFPSTHAATAGTLAVLTAFHLKRLTNFPNPFIYSLVGTAAILVGVSRIAVKAHTTIDVTAGLVLGLGLGFVAALSWPYWYQLLNRLATHQQPTA